MVKNGQWYLSRNISVFKCYRIVLDYYFLEKKIKSKKKVENIKIKNKENWQR